MRARVVVGGCVAALLGACGHSTALVDGAPAADAGQDGATSVDANVTPVTCGPPTELDTAGNTVGNVRAMTLAAGRYAVSWTEIPGSGVQIAKVRVFDGAQLQAEQILSPPTPIRTAIVAAAGQGYGYAAWQGASAFGRSVLDPATASFGAPTSVTTGLNIPSALAGLPDGRAVLMYLASGPGGFPSPTVTIYDPNGAAWSAPETLLDGNFRVEGLGANAAGRAAVSWIDTFATGSPLYVSTFDGATWSAASAGHPLVSAGTVGEQTPVVLANGDVVVVYGGRSASGPTIESVRYRASSGMFDQALTIDPGPGANTISAVIDAADRITVFYLSHGETMAVRDVGAGWTAPVDLGAAAGTAIAAIDPDGNVTMFVDGTAALRRIAAGSNAWSDPIPTGLTANDGAGNVAIAFDALGNPIVFARQLVASRPALEAVVCK